MNNQHPILFARSINPVLIAADRHYPINSFFDTGVTIMKDGTTLLLSRVEGKNGLTYLRSARKS